MKKIIQIILAAASLGVMGANAQKTSSTEAQNLASSALPAAGANQADVAKSVKALVDANPTFAVEIAAAAIAKFPSFKALIVSTAGSAVSIVSVTIISPEFKTALNDGLNNLLNGTGSIISIIIPIITPFRESVNNTLQNTVFTIPTTKV